MMVKCIICGDPVNPHSKGNFRSHAIRSGFTVAICKKPECARKRKTQLQAERREKLRHIHDRISPRLKHSGAIMPHEA